MNNFIKTAKIKSKKKNILMLFIKLIVMIAILLCRTDKKKLRTHLKEHINDLKNLLIFCLLSLVTNLIMIIQLIGKMLVFSIQTNLIIKG